MSDNPTPDQIIRFEAEKSVGRWLRSMVEEFGSECEAAKLSDRQLSKEINKWIKHIKEYKQVPAHPGVMLLNEFIAPTRMSLEKFSKRSGIELRILKKITDGEIPIEFEQAEKLAKMFKPNAGFWMDMQAYYNAVKANLSGRTKK